MSLVGGFQLHSCVSLQVGLVEQLCARWLPYLDMYESLTWVKRTGRSMLST